MEKLQFPLLQANDIECRVGNVSKQGKGFSLLLYKNARTDIKYLNEVVGVLNWKREHIMVGDTQFCVVSIYDAERNQWVSKADCGSESDIEKQKGLSSDCFKRSCFSWGLGIELYSAPFIWVNSTPSEIENDKRKTYLVKTISYNEKTREITQLEIVREDTGELVYTFGTKNKVAKPKATTETKSTSVEMATEEQKLLIEMFIAKLDDERTDKFNSWLRSKYHIVNINDEMSSEIAEEIITAYKLRG